MISFQQFLNEEMIKSETYWRQVLKGNDFALRVLDSIMARGGEATERQMEVLRRAEKGIKTPYHPRN